MGVRLDRLPEFFDKWRAVYELVDGWQTRSRSSGDFVDVMGVGIHHTASSTTAARDETWCITNSPDRPIGNGLLRRDGVFRLWSVRATNTQGRGGPYLTSRGVIPLNSGNTRMFSIEAANNGVGEPWTPEMLAAYPRICAAVIDCVNETTPGRPLTAGDVIAHFEWAPGRKFDPAGPSPYAFGKGLWDMDLFRRDVFTELHPPPPPPDPVEDFDVLKALVQMDNNPAVFGQFSGGYKVWYPSWEAVTAAAALARLDGRVLKVQTFKDRDMFTAFGPVLGPVPDGADLYGMYP